MKIIQYVFDAKVRCLAFYPDKVITVEGPEHYPTIAKEHAYKWIVAGSGMSAWDLTLREDGSTERQAATPRFHGISILPK